MTDAIQKDELEAELRNVRNVFFFQWNFVDSINLTSVSTVHVFLLPCTLSLVFGPPSYPSNTTDALMNLDLDKFDV